jgi:hypothetical protein
MVGPTNLVFMALGDRLIVTKHPLRAFRYILTTKFEEKGSSRTKTPESVHYGG